MNLLRFELLGYFTLSAAFNSYAQFFEITSSENIVVINTGTYDGNGTSFKDFNSDGWDDLTFGTSNGMPRFYQNFEGNPEEVFFLLPNYPDAQIKALQWVDYDNDGDQDLFLSYSGSGVKLYSNNSNMEFEDVTDSAGLLEENVDHFGTAWSDTDRDGNLDLYISKYTSTEDLISYELTNRFYHNNGDGTFSDYTVLSNLDGVIHSCFQPVFFDFNGDHLQDLYVLIDRHVESNIMYKNNGDGTYTDVSVLSGTDIAVDAMGGSIDDYDNDGDIDIYVSNGYDGNVLLRNNGDATFSDVSANYDLQAYRICWGDMWIDYNNDSHKDLWVSTTINNWASDQNLFFINNGDNTFLEDIYTSGIDGDMDPTFSCSMGDLNQDGYFDFITNNNDPRPSSIWQNTTGTNNFLSITLTGTESNRDAVGTLIECYTDGHINVNHLLNSENYLGQNAAREIFGLAEATLVDSLVIYWPSGLVETYYDIEVPAYKHYVEGAQLFEQVYLEYEGDLTLCPGETLTISCGEGVSYLWNTGEVSQSISVNQAGNYSVLVVNDNGSLIPSDTLLIQDAAIPLVNATIHPVSCYAGSDGSIELECESQIDVVWSTGQTGLTISSLVSDWYSYQFTTLENCSLFDSLWISQADTMTVQLQIGNVNCFGEESGTVQTIVGGGTPPYSLDWGIKDPLQLSAGIHCVSIIDSLQCEISACVEVTEPEQLFLDIIINPAFENGSGGSAIATITGGASPYQLIWSNGVSDLFNLENLAPGVYSLLVTDSNGCVVEQVFEIEFIVSLNQSDKESISIFPTPCFDQLSIKNIKAFSQCHIYDTLGKLILWIPLTESNETINCSNWKSGVYYMHITSSTSTLRQMIVKN